MSTTTSDLQLFKYDTSTDGKEVFSISSALNANWDKIDSFASAIKSLSNLSTEGEKRFTDLENSIANKLEADVLLAENGYIKFNNGLLICFGRISSAEYITLPIAYTTKIFSALATVISGGDIGFDGNPPTAMEKYFSLTRVRFVLHNYSIPTNYYITIGY